jgi:hypothetical protein
MTNQRAQDVATHTITIRNLKRELADAERNSATLHARELRRAIAEAEAAIATLIDNEP